uniref:W2 domain-containing protein n=1 Tax=Propithecus coquereli TaxID=379532 RepID=A0A2K6F9D9_PROCO
SSKQQKPTLSGQRFKTRKRDEKERFDPTRFQDCITQGLTETGTDLEAVAKFLNASGAKLDYRQYAETLFDILVVGGMLAPGGTLAGDMMHTDRSQEDLETMHYKYLEKGFEDEVKKLLLFLKGFSEWERNKLAALTGILLANGTFNASILNSLYNENLVKEGVSAAFAVKLFKSWINEKDINCSSCKSLETFRVCSESLQKELQEQMSHDDPFEDMISYQGGDEKKTTSQNWLELVAERVIKHLKQDSPVLAASTTQGQSEPTLLLKIQKCCYDNIHFTKAFQKIVVLFYKAEDLSEEPILKWYKDARVAKGKKSVFFEQMKKFVEWLRNVEEVFEPEGEEGDQILKVQPQ